MRPRAILLLAGCGGASASPRTSRRPSRRGRRGPYGRSHRATDWPVRLRSDGNCSRPHLGRDLREADGLRARGAKCRPAITSRRASRWLLSMPAIWTPASARRKPAQAEVRSAMPEADSAVAAAKANLDLAQVDLQPHAGPVPEEIDLQPGIRRSLGEAQGRPGRARYGAGQTRPARLEARAANRRFAPRKSRAVTPKSPRPSRRGHGQIGRTGHAGRPRRAAVDHRTRRRVPAGSVGRRIAPGGDPVRAAGVGDPRRSRPRLRRAVSEIVPAVDAGRRAAYIVKIDLPAACGRCAPGCSGARLSLGSHSTGDAIPAGAVVERGQLQSVFVVENGSRPYPPGHPRREAATRPRRSALRAQCRRQGYRPGFRSASTDGSRWRSRP